MDFLASETSAAFDLALIAHVLLAVACVVVLGAAYAAAAALGRRGPGDAWQERDRRFFRPGPEISGRIVYLVPLSGLLLVGLSDSEFSMSDGFIWIGMLLSLVAIGLGELLAFPALGRLRQLVSGSEAAPGADDWRSDLATLRWAVDGVILALVLGSIAMVAKP